MKKLLLQHRNIVLKAVGSTLIIVGLVLLYSAVTRSDFFGTEKKSNPPLLNFDIDEEPDSSEFVETTSTLYRLVIPKIGVDMPIVLGETDEKKGLDGGAWHIPGTAVPGIDDMYNNIVLSAHRFKYTSGKYTFFEVDKLVEGDEILITSENTELKYIVTGTEVVLPNAVRILEKSDTPMLTLFTCTPKFSSKYRLVIYAKPAQVDVDNAS